jgi:hypothetical protein
MKTSFPGLVFIFVSLFFLRPVAYSVDCKPYFAGMGSPAELTPAASRHALGIDNGNIAVQEPVTESAIIGRTAHFDGLTGGMEEGFYESGMNGIVIGIKDGAVQVFDEKTGTLYSISNDGESVAEFSLDPSGDRAAELAKAKALVGQAAKTTTQVAARYPEENRGEKVKLGKAGAMIFKPIAGLDLIGKTAHFPAYTRRGIHQGIPRQLNGKIAAIKTQGDSVTLSIRLENGEITNVSWIEEVEIE